MRKAILFLTFLFMAPHVLLVAMDDPQIQKDDDNEPLISKGMILSSEEQVFVNELAKIFVDLHVSNLLSASENAVKAIKALGLSESFADVKIEEKSDPIGATTALFQQIQEMQNTNGFKEHKLNEKTLAKTNEAFLEAWNETQNPCLMVNCLKVNTPGSFFMGLSDAGFGLGGVASGGVVLKGISCLLMPGMVCFSLSAAYAIFRTAFACRGWEQYREREAWLESTDIRHHIRKAALEYANTLELDQVFSPSRERIKVLISNLQREF